MSGTDFASSFQDALVRKATDTNRTAVGRTLAKLPGGNAVLQQLYYEDPAPRPGHVHLLVSFKLDDGFYQRGAKPEEIEATLEDTKKNLLKWTNDRLGISGGEGTVIDKIEEGRRHLHLAPRATMQGRVIAYENAPHNRFVVKYELPDSPETAEACRMLNEQFGKKPAQGRA